MILVKLGGSAITDKRRYRALRSADLARLAREVAAAAHPETVIVHGAGSFGHILAAKHRLHEGVSDDAQLDAVAQVQRDVRALNLEVLDALIRARLRPVSIPPSAVLRHHDGRLLRFDIGPFRDFLIRRLHPVSYGDVVLDTKRRFSIASGDDVILEIAKAFRPERVVFAADVDGVFTADPKASKAAELLHVVDAASLDRVAAGGPPDAPDVTGGLRGKLERMLAIARHARDVRIVNGLVKGRLQVAMRGGNVVGTRVVA